RADPRHRCRRQGRGPRHDRRAGGRGHRHHPDFVRPARGAGDERPRADHARGPPDGGARPRRCRRGDGDDCRHGPGPGLRPRRAERRRGMSWLQRHIRPEQVRELSLLLLIIVAVVIFGSLIDGYYTSRTFNRVASSVAIIAVIAVGQTLVVLTRNIDLSVGSIVGCTPYFAGSRLAAP